MDLPLQRKPWKPSKFYEDQREKINDNQEALTYVEMLDKYCQNTLIWRTGSGDDIIIKNLTDDHIDKLINFLKEKDENKKVNRCKVKHWLLIIQTEKNLRENP